MFADKVKDLRDNQLRYVRNVHIFFSLVFMFMMSSGYVMSVVLFGYHWAQGKNIDYSSAMVVLTLVGYISYRNIVMFFSALNYFLRLKVIFKRADEVLAMDEFTESHADLADNEHEGLAIHCDNLTATWGFQIKKDIYTGNTQLVDQLTNNLIGVSFEAEIADLVVVVGPVGSGKSTLLAAIMKELSFVEGSLKTRGRICYVEQDPFIMSESVKNNILFGLPYDEDRFDEVVRVC